MLSQLAQMTLPLAYIGEQKAFGTFWSNLHLSTSGVCKVLEKPWDVYTSLHKGEIQGESVELFTEFQRSFVNTCT